MYFLYTYIYISSFIYSNFSFWLGSLARIMLLGAPALAIVRRVVDVQSAARLNDDVFAIYRCVCEDIRRGVREGVRGRLS